MLRAEDGYWDRRIDMFADPVFWLFAVPLAVLWGLWDRHAAKKRGRPLTLAEHWGQFLVVFLVLVSGAGVVFVVLEMT
ncbi:hypothetical protein [Aeromicrobium sp. Leaf272]|uniref:hypothetical protein n=1 Tax=Aeromicrobium sp. Leaf272 TaxID=1736317 RepID=UPI0006F9E6E4|nr:hypothetical protein [Aeromicrobium sp. Leaf272]KQP26181.1 hypothetical protein ASF38_11120 [Aeromicrobium sp. Leaf272]